MRMTPELRVALDDAIRDEPWGWEAVQAVLDRLAATPDGPIDDTDYDIEDENHIVTTIEYFGLGHLAR